MSVLTAKGRNALPDKAFAGPGRSFPVQDASHARNALARVANKSPAVKAEVRAKVHSKYPAIGEKKKTTPEGREVERRLGAKDKWKS